MEIRTMTTPPRHRKTIGRESDPVFALPYADLQEIHSLVGMVCGWRMSLPTKMITQAKLVETRMITLNRIDLSQRERLRQAKAFKAKLKKMFV